MGALGDDFAQCFNVSGALLEHLVPYLFCVTWRSLAWHTAVE